jgi:hypothetical protein
MNIIIEIKRLRNINLDQKREVKTWFPIDFVTWRNWILHWVALELLRHYENESR